MPGFTDLLIIERSLFFLSSYLIRFGSQSEAILIKSFQKHSYHFETVSLETLYRKHIFTETRNLETHGRRNRNHFKRFSIQFSQWIVYVQMLLDHTPGFNTFSHRFSNSKFVIKIEKCKYSAPSPFSLLKRCLWCGLIDRIYRHPLSGNIGYFKIGGARYKYNKKPFKKSLRRHSHELDL